MNCSIVFRRTAVEPALISIDSNETDRSFYGFQRAKRRLDEFDLFVF